MIGPAHTASAACAMTSFTLCLCALATSTRADPAMIEGVRIDGARVDVTLSHGDTGWDHYADGWRVELADGTILGTRVLAHPHVTEQPFTRSAAIDLPADVSQVFIRASTSVEGWAETVVSVDLE